MSGDARRSEQDPPAGPTLLLYGGRLPDGRAVDIRIGAGRIEEIGPAGRLSAPERLDLSGYLLLPAPVEPHAHLDEAFATTRPGPEGGDSGAAETVEAAQRRITEAALSGLGYGATVQRTHVRIGEGYGLRRLEAALQAARALRGLAELQVVARAGPLSSAAGAAGAEGRALLAEAVAMGAHAIGGCPELDPDPVGFVRTAAAVAEGSELALDLHTDAATPHGLARLVEALDGLPRSGVNLGPCAALGLLGDEDLVRTLDLLAASGLTVTCLPQGNRCVGLPPAAPGCPRTPPLLPPVRLLRAAGVVVAAGSGGLRDRANPVGRADPLESAFLLAAAGELDPAEAYAAVSSAARAVLGLTPVQLVAGSPADLLAVRGEHLPGVLSGGHSRVVLHAGRVVSRTSAVREYADPIAPAVPRQGRSGPTGPG